MLSYLLWLCNHHVHICKFNHLHSIRQKYSVLACNYSEGGNMKNHVSHKAK